MSLPTADDLFRRTGDTSEPPPSESPNEPPPSEPHSESPSEPPPSEPTSGPDAEDEPESGGDMGRRRPSGRVRHDEKMTVYVTADELVDIEHTRLMLRRSNGLAVDRGRLVREAIAIALADFEANGDESVLVQRLTQT